MLQECNWRLFMIPSSIQWSSVPRYWLCWWVETCIRRYNEGVHNLTWLLNLQWDCANWTKERALTILLLNKCSSNWSNWGDNGVQLIGMHPYKRTRPWSKIDMVIEIWFWCCKRTVGNSWLGDACWPNDARRCSKRHGSCANGASRLDCLDQQLHRYSIFGRRWSNLFHGNRSNHSSARTHWRKGSYCNHRSCKHRHFTRTIWYVVFDRHDGFLFGQHR